MQTKEEFIKEIIQNNTTITDTVNILFKLNSDPLNEITVNDFLNYDGEFLINQPPDDQIDYCKQIIKSCYCKNVKTYFSRYLGENSILTFNNIVSYYISEKINQGDSEENSDEENNEDENEDDDEENEDEEDNEHDEDENNEENSEIIKLLSDQLNKLNNITTEKQLIVFLYECSFDPTSLSYYEESGEYPDPEHFLESEIEKILKNRSNKQISDFEQDNIDEILNSILKQLNFDIDYERYHFDDESWIGIFNFDIDSNKLKLGAIGSKDSNEYGIQADNFIEIKRRELLITIWDKK